MPPSTSRRRSGGDDAKRFLLLLVAGTLVWLLVAWVTSVPRETVRDDASVAVDVTAIRLELASPGPRVRKETGSASAGDLKRLGMRARLDSRLHRAAGERDATDRVTADVREPVFHTTVADNPFDSTRCRTMQVVGLFNTGTNYMHKLLKRNMKKDPGVVIQYDSPWKHRMPMNASAFETPDTAACHVVMVRNPVSWIASMRKANYDLYCDGHFNTTDCHRHTSEYYDTHWHFDTIMALWNEWYAWYLKIPGHFTIVRYEDMLAHSETVLRHVQRTMRVPLKGDLQLQLDNPAKGHGKPRGFSNAFNYNLHKKYLETFSKEELLNVVKGLDMELVNMFDYTIAK